MAFYLLVNPDHVIVSVSFHFLLNSQRDACFYHIAYDYSHANLGVLCNHMRDVPWEDIFNIFSASPPASEFCKWVHGFQLFMLMS